MRSQIVFSKLLKKDVSQTVQRFSELQGINQGLAAHVIFVEPVQISAGKHKGRNPFAVVSEPDFA